jgi:uncharacterized membrane protein YedE/YeeE
MAFLTALLAGILFGGGLLLSGMSDPQRVLAFLDVTGAWNPALALTMAGAIAVALPAFFFVRTHHADLRGAPAELPNRFNIDGRLVAGSSIFGLGWGLSGICPGPGLLLLTGASAPALVFFAGLIAGFLALRVIDR